ncbi:hypothetical protein H6F94_03365 [Leptolyngbya sp. FACHB-261]|nr:hypothetical protein [Leptolyngbya sp. FACHB-261]
MLELRTALELATDDELRDLADLLFRRRFNPLDYITLPELSEIQERSRSELIDLIEQRFCYLAADGVTVLRGQTQRLSYHQVLQTVCKHLKLPCSPHLSVVDLEAEVFLNLMGRIWQKMTPPDRARLSERFRTALRRTTRRSEVLAHHLKAQTQSADPLRLILEGGGALAVSAIVRPLLLNLVARQLAWHYAVYQTGQQMALKGGAALATQIQGRFAMQLAKRGMAVSAARYGALRATLSVVGPALWTWFLADLGWRMITTNYARIIPAIFTLAQIRLTRSSDFGDGQLTWECPPA